MRHTTNCYYCVQLTLVLCAIGVLTRASQIGSLNAPCDQRPALAPCHTLNSVCINNTCQCASPYTARNGVCTFAPGETTVNSPCATNADCFGQGEFCNYGFCRCMRNHVEIDRHCLPVIYPGQHGCEDSRQCSTVFPGSVCRSRYCECPEGLTAAGQTCVLEGADLSVTNTFANDHNRLYEVETQTVGRRGVINLQALPAASNSGTVPPGGVCSHDQECAGSPYAYCMGTCMCRDGAINAGSTCLEPGSTSRGNCGTGQVYVSEAGACMNVARPGEPCQYSQQCSGTEVGAFCVNLRCRCVYGMVVTGDGRCTFINSNCTARGTVWISELGECKPVIAPGARTCTHRQQCIASYPDSMCFLTACTCPELQPVAVDGTCGTSCSSGQTFSGVLGKCVPTVQPGDRCQYSSQCHAIYPGMICDKGICRCPNSQMWTGSACSVTCPAGYMMNPRSGMCRPICRNNQIEYEGECLNTVGPGHPCHISQQCQGGSNCINQLCECPQGTHSLHGTCSRATSQPGGACGDGEFCSGGSFCENRICTCPMGTVRSNQQCITPANVPPNSPCGPTVQCSGNSVCINGACVCAEGQVPINGFCNMPPSVPPGYPCTVSDRCTLGSVCQNGVCQCPMGTVLNENRCLVPIQVPPGAACRSGIELCTGLSFCVQNICSCPVGMIAQGSMCRTPSLVQPGSSCANQEKCGGGSECIGNVCVCPPGTKIVNLQCQFAASVPPNFSCANGELCTGGSACQEGVCRCPAGQTPFNQICQSSSVASGASCFTNEQCTGGSVCLANQCVCRPPETRMNGICVNTNSVPPGARCHQRARCIGGSRCVDGVCRCVDNRIQRGRNCVLLRVLEPESQCSPDDSLSRCGGGSWCERGLCRCPSGHIVDRQRCIESPRVPPLSSCNSGETCIGGSYCQNGACTCPQNMVVKNQECVFPPKVPPGGACPTGTESCSGGSSCTMGFCKCPTGQVVRDQTCALPSLASPPLGSCALGQTCGGGSLCRNRVCSCPSGSVVVGDQCYSVDPVPPGSSCSSGETCGGGSVCINSICVCPPTYAAVAGMCRPTATVAPTASCANGEKCGGGSSCVEGICTCPADQAVINQRCQDPPIVGNRRYRARRAVVEADEPFRVVGQSCAPIDRCFGGAVCQSGVCQCPPGTGPQHNRCVAMQVGRMVTPGALCAPTDVCTGGSYCQGGMCVCPPGRGVQRFACVTLVVGPGFSCANAEKCCGGSQCINGVCSCPAGMMMNEDQVQCVPAVMVNLANPGQACDFGTVCGGGSSCQNHICACPSGLTPQMQMCLSPGRSAPPGGACVVGRISCSGGSFCLDGVCSCAAGLITRNQICMSPSATNTAFPGQPCTSSSICAGGSVCDNGICNCLPGQSLQNGVCVEADIVAAPGAPCTEGVTVCSGNAQCSNGFCVCQAGQIVENQQCVSTGTDHTAFPGQPCDFATRCAGGSFCKEGMCTCPPGHLPKNQMCVATGTTNEVPPGESCQAPGSSCGGGSFCINNFCTCPQGQTVANGVCVALDRSGKTAYPGQQCTASTACAGGSSCIGGLCTCPPSQIVLNNECRPRQATVSPGMACDANSMCMNGAKCINGVCFCPPGQIAENGQCVTRANAVPPGYQCTPGVSFCTGGSFCMNDRCVCTSGQIIVNEQCTNAAARKTRDPQGPADESSGDGGNETKVSPGGSCVAPEAVCGGGSSCVNGYCVCPVGSFLNGNTCSSSSAYEVPPGADCLADGSGCGGGSACLLGKCVCGPGQVVVNGICSMTGVTVPPGSSCDVATTCPSCRIGCGGGSTCIMGSCVCAAGQTVREGQCVPSSDVGPHAHSLSAPPGSPCINQRTVCTGGSSCLNGLCACPDDSTVNAALQCVSNKDFGRPSQEIEIGGVCVPGQAPCAGNAICRQSICVCPDHLVNHRGQCVSTIEANGFVAPGSPCNQSSPQSICGGDSHCLNGICSCIGGKFASGGRCVSRFGVPPGTLCFPGVTVCDGNAVCRDNICSCAENEALVDGVCTASRGRSNFVNNNGKGNPPNSPCSLNMGCTGGAMCLNDVCTCPRGNIVRNNVCVPEHSPVLLLGDKCSPLADTCGGGSTCRNNICSCAADETVAGDQCVSSLTMTNSSQLPLNSVHVPPASPCAETSSCGGGSYCFNGFCTCPPGHVIEAGRCIFNDPLAPRKLRDLIENFAPPGSWCGGAVVCNGGSYCYNNVCTCPFGQLIVNLQCAEAPIVSPSSSCLNGEICGGGSICTQGKCSCPNGTSQSGRTCKNVYMSAKVQHCPLPDDPTACQLPDCYCSQSGTDIPGNLVATDIPQMVVLTVDDAMNSRIMPFIRRLFDGRYKNPNGCDIKATFFVSHEWNNYDEVQWVYWQGHEIAVNSISHQTLTSETVERWSAEMVGMRTILKEFAGVAPESVRGIRAPQLAVGGNSQFEMMRQEGFLYDNSMSANPGKQGPAYWPQTLDFSLPWRCETEPCPDRGFPGLWAVPINQFFGYYLPEIQEHKRGAMVRAAMSDVDETVDTLYNMLMDNFNRVYRSNRAPYLLTLETAFFSTLPNNGSIEALENFLSQILRNQDVYIVTNLQMIDWIKQPTPLAQLGGFERWKCEGNQQVGTAPCQSPQRCGFRTQLPFGERWFNTCFTCPRAYPWLNNPTGALRK